MKRLAHVDTMKAIGIVLVVAGHSPGLSAMAKSFIYAFHMPLFFFISGLLLPERKLSASGREHLASLWRGLGVPYLFFFALSYLYWLPAHGLTARASRYEELAWWEPLIGVAIGNGDALFVNVTLWFFTCLFTASLIFFWARKRFSPAFLFVAFNLAAFAFTLAHDRSWMRLPWGLDNAIIALAFYSTGHVFRAWQTRIVEKTPTPTALTLALTAAAGLAWLAAFNGETDLNKLDFGRREYLYLANAYLGIGAIFCLSIVLPAQAVSEWLAKNTIIIFPTHLLLFGVFTGVGVMAFGLPHAFKESSPLWTVLFPVLALSLSYSGALLLRRFFPAVFGGRPRRAESPGDSGRASAGGESGGPGCRAAGQSGVS